MAYTPTTWVDGTTPVNAENLNKIETGVDAADQAAADAQASADTKIPLAQKAAINGVATLDASGKVPVAQLPAMPGGADLTYEGDYAPATEYQDGDVVVKDGVAYLCVGGPTTEAPDLAPWGPTGLSVLGEELGYAELTSPLSINAAAAGSAQTIVTAPAITLDGSTAIMVEFFCPQARQPNVAGGQFVFELYEDGNRIGNLAQPEAPTANNISTVIFAARRLIPAAGAHIYSIRAWLAGGGTGTVGAGAGGAGTQVPTFIRVVRVLPSPPKYPASPLTPPTYGITLPLSPADGQEAILVDSIVNPSYQWRFRYNAGSTSPYKWEFIGGSPITLQTTDPNAALNTQTQVGSSGYYRATSGGAVTVPLAGDYMVSGTLILDLATQTNIQVVLGVFAGAAITGASTWALSSVGGLLGPSHSGIRASGLAAGTAVGLAIQGGAVGTSKLRNGQIIVTPVRVA